MNKSALDLQVKELEESLKRLRKSYEKYFAGVERREPLQEHEQFKRRLREVKKNRVNNTALRFRLQSVQSTLVQHEQHWKRICRKIEEGTFRRDYIKKRSGGERADAPTPQETVATPPKTAPTKAPTYSDSVRKLHQAYQAARQKVGDARPVSIDQIARTVKKQKAAIQQKYGARGVEFRVAVKDGKAILKAVPKSP